MLFQFVNMIRLSGKAKVSGKDYDFQFAQGLIDTERGPQICEVMLDKDHPALEFGKKYRVEMEFYPDKEKKLAFRVRALVAIPVSAAKSA